MLHLGDGQHRVGFGVDAAVGDVDTLVAEQVLKQQAPDRAECPFHGLLGTSRQMRSMRLVRTVLFG